MPTSSEAREVRPGPGPGPGPGVTGGLELLVKVSSVRLGSLTRAVTLLMLGHLSVPPW